MGASLQWAIQAQPAGREQLAPTNIHFPCVLTTPEPPGSSDQIAVILELCFLEASTFWSS